MLPIQIDPFDPPAASPESWAAYHPFRRAVAAELSPDEPMLSDADIQFEMQRVDPLWESRRWLALVGTEVIGSLRVGFRRPGTPNAAEHEPFLNGGGSVRADARRRGVGALLLREVQALMHRLDKTVLTLSAHAAPGHAFLTHVGAAEKFSMVESRAVLAQLDWVSLREWEATAEKLGLVWERHAGRIPRNMLLALLSVFTTLFADMPIGALEMPTIRSEISGYDQWYETIERVGGAHYLIVLRAPDGSVAGLTEAGWDSRIPDIAYQQLTAVAHPWRGHGLARALKARMLRQVHSHHPEVKMMSTGNAETNAAMLSINARVGFTVRRRIVDYQIKRTELDAWFGATALGGLLAHDPGLRSRAAKSCSSDAAQGTGAYATPNIGGSHDHLGPLKGGIGSPLTSLCCGLPRASRNGRRVGQ
jgi:GNAT superfamily N-acetyltransferase